MYKISKLDNYYGHNFFNEHLGTAINAMKIPETGFCDWTLYQRFCKEEISKKRSNI